MDICKKSISEIKFLVSDSIREFCDTHTSRQRSDLYDFLNSKLFSDEQVLSVYNYDGTNDHARFSEYEDFEFKYVVKKVLEYCKI